MTLAVREFDIASSSKGNFQCYNVSMESVTNSAHVVRTVKHMYIHGQYKSAFLVCLFVDVTIVLDTVNLKIFARILFSRSFGKIKSSRNGKIIPSTTDIGKSWSSRELFWSRVCLLTLFAKIKFSRKFPDLQYIHGHNKRLYLLSLFVDVTIVLDI